MSPVGGDQLTAALNPSKLCTAVGRGTDLGAVALNIRQIEHTEPNNSVDKSTKIRKVRRNKSQRNDNNKKVEGGRKESKTIGRVHLVKKWIPSVLIGPVNQTSALA